MSLVAAVVTGGAIGLNHSLEADHVAAVATLVDEGGSERAGLIGASWGIGHSVPIVVLGVAFLLVGAQIPHSLTSLFEALAGLVLVALGLRVLHSLVAVTEHTHDGHTHSHLTVGSLSLGTTHSHREGESFLVGIVHGLAGSGTLVVLLVATAPTIGTALSFLGAFTLVSVTTMGALAALWGRAVSTRLSRRLQAIAGIASVVVGALLLGNEVIGMEVFGDGHGDATPVHALKHEYATALVDVGSGVLDGVLLLPPVA